MESNIYLYKAVNELGNSLDGFETKTEAEFFRDNQASLEHQWRIVGYKANKIEKNYF